MPLPITTEPDNNQKYLCFLLEFEIFDVIFKVEYDAKIAIKTESATI